MHLYKGPILPHPELSVGEEAITNPAAGFRVKIRALFLFINWVRDRRSAINNEV